MSVNAYRDVLTRPKALRFVAAGFVGRMPMAMMNLAILLLLAALTGSYGTAGTAAATSAIGYAAAAPLIGRLADRHGQRRVLLPMAVGHAVAVTTLVGCAVAGAPPWVLFPAAAAIGMTSPALGSMVRARWVHLLGDGPALRTAFSLESVADESIYVAGPLIVTALVTTAHPMAGVAVAGVLTVAGSLALSVQVSTQPPARPRPHGGAGSALAVPGLRLLVPVFLLVGAVFSAIEVSVVAFAQAERRPGMAGVVLASYALGSVLAGLWYGGRNWRVSLPQRFVTGVTLFALSTVPLPFISHLAPLTAFMLVAGLTISPVLVPGMELAQRLVAAHLRTEGLTWISTSIGVGVALGASLSGRIVDAFGVTASFGAVIVAGGAAALTGWTGRRWLRGPAPAPAVPSGTGAASAPATAPSPAPRE